MEFHAFIAGAAVLVAAPLVVAQNAAAIKLPVYSSAFEAYLPYRDEKLANWRDVNDNVLGDDPSAPSLTSAQRGATQDQTTLIVHAPDLLTSQRQLYIDHWGNPLLSPSANQVPATGTGYVDVGVQHLKLVDFKWANQLPMAEYLNSYPGLDVPGNQTQGIAWDIWRLANKLFGYKSGTAYTKSEIMDIIMGTGTLGLKSLGRCFGYAVIRFDIP